MNIVLATPLLAAHIEPETGRLLAVRNLARNLDLIRTPPASPPFRMELRETGWVEDFTHCSVTHLKNGIQISWETAHAITVVSDLTVRGDEILCTLRVHNRGRATIDQVEYPIIGNIGRLGGPGQDELIHSHGTGMLFHDPLDLFKPDPENRRRLRYSVYPEGFAGSTMQMMAYYARDRGGFSITTEDSGCAVKAFNFFKEDDLLRATIIHKAPVLEPGLDFAPAYPVALAALTTGNWYEAADRYKRWALDQPWARPRPRPRWLLEDVGLCTFGVNARYDRAAWLNHFHEIAGTPVFHVLGPNWPKFGQDYQNNLPRGKDDWFPAQFSAANLATIRRNGDFWAPFEFDLLCNHSPDLPDPVLASRVVPKESELDPDVPRFPYMCAGTDYWRDLHVWRDEQLVAEHDCDALYYDISVSNLPLQCLAQDHLHAPGAGASICEAFTSMYRDTSAAMNRAKGVDVPMGSEVISECFLNIFDFYQARAEASPLAPFEVDCFRDWIVAGRAQTIPLFTYIYHERGPVRMDGWCQLAHEAGDLFYGNAARVLLNGGLVQLNYEWCGLEELDGARDDPGEHYFPFKPRPFTIDPAKAAFIGELARTRVGLANPFLAYGKMLPAPLVEAPTVDLDYFVYNVFPSTHYEERGTMIVPSVLATAWDFQGRQAWCVANLLPQAQTVRVNGQSMPLPPRRVVLVEQ